MITAGLDRRQVAILRAYRKYRQRVGSRFTESYQNDVLVANSEVTAKLVRFFELRFDPELESDDDAEQALRDEILRDLDQVASLDHDRILRNQLAVIDATLRTNAYNADREALAFKLRSADVPAIPQPAPFVEIYVYSPDVEGIHLRGGRIARGGLRWSDRQDYRTEVFGLMRAQVTKNAVIVPAGAKGGFYIKRGDDVQRHYVTFIRSLLSVTDNLVDGASSSRRVCASATRTTRTSSWPPTRARQRSRTPPTRSPHEYGFWLDDAFASGGSAGYDHKELGITARGAWESVKRHFRELGIDTQADEFTVVGIGDMSGDVFGNGMLLSRQDPARRGLRPPARVHRPATRMRRSGFAERKRLFELPRSSWDDYSRELISEGGGVYPRTAKSITLSPQAREALGDRRRVAAADRGHPRDPARAGRPAVERRHRHRGQGVDRDRRRRRGPRLGRHPRQRGRVAREGRGGGRQPRPHAPRAASSSRRGGGRINADFIDNSAGVDCSDHEVNLKILLGLAEQRRRARPREERDELLLAVTDDVVAHVLHDSFLQAQIIAQEVDRSGSRLFAYEDLMRAARGARRSSTARPRTCRPTRSSASAAAPAAAMERPELAVLVAYSKQLLARALERTDFVEEPWLERDLRGYFPPRGGQALRAPARRAPAAPRADLHGQLERGRQRARADVRVPARRRARRRAGRRRARLPDRARGHRRRRALGGRRAARRAVTAPHTSS